MRRWTCIAVLVLQVSGSEAFAQSLQESVRREATRAATQQSEPQGEPNRIPPGLLWTGIGLMGGGVLFMAVGVALAESADPCAKYRGDRTVTCTSDAGDFKAVGIGIGGAIIGTGAVLEIIGMHKRNASPELVMIRGGFAVRSRLTF